MFIYKNIRSDDMGLKIEGGLTFIAPARDIELIEIQGRDGDVLIDRQRYRSVERSILCRLVPVAGDIEQLINEIHNWLSTDVNYHNFIWSGDPDFTYKALVHEEYDTQRILRQYGKTVLKFRFHPIKYLTSSLTEQNVTTNTNINNPYPITAKPIIRIVGTGNITVRIGSSELVLQGIDGGCIVDSESQTITSLDGSRTLFDRMYSYPFPALQPSSNLITFSSEIQVFITPRLGALIS